MVVLVVKTEVWKAILAIFDIITPKVAYRATRNITRKTKPCVREREKHLEQLFENILIF